MVSTARVMRQVLDTLARAEEHVQEAEQTMAVLTAWPETTPSTLLLDAGPTMLSAARYSDSSAKTAAATAIFGGDLNVDDAACRKHQPVASLDVAGRSVGGCDVSLFGDDLNPNYDINRRRVPTVRIRPPSPAKRRTPRHPDLSVLNVSFSAVEPAVHAPVWAPRRHDGRNNALRGQDGQNNALRGQDGGAGSTDEDEDESMEQQLERSGILPQQYGVPGRHSEARRRYHRSTRRQRSHHSAGDASIKLDAVLPSVGAAVVMKPVHVERRGPPAAPREEQALADALRHQHRRTEDTLVLRPRPPTYAMGPAPPVTDAASDNVARQQESSTADAVTVVMPGDTDLLTRRAAPRPVIPPLPAPTTRTEVDEPSGIENAVVSAAAPHVLDEAVQRRVVAATMPTAARFPATRRPSVHQQVLEPRHEVVQRRVTGGVIAPPPSTEAMRAQRRARLHRFVDEMQRPTLHVSHAAVEPSVQAPVMRPPTHRQHVRGDDDADAGDAGGDASAQFLALHPNYDAVLPSHPTAVVMRPPDALQQRRRSAPPVDVPMRTGNLDAVRPTPPVPLLPLRAAPVRPWAAIRAAARQTEEASQRGPGMYGVPDLAATLPHTPAARIPPPPVPRRADPADAEANAAQQPALPPLLYPDVSVVLPRAPAPLIPQLHQPVPPPVPQHPEAEPSLLQPRYEAVDRRVPAAVIPPLAVPRYPPIRIRSPSAEAHAAGATATATPQHQLVEPRVIGGYISRVSRPSAETTATASLQPNDDDGSSEAVGPVRVYDPNYDAVLPRQRHVRIPAEVRPRGQSLRRQLILDIDAALATLEPAAPDLDAVRRLH